MEDQINNLKNRILSKKDISKGTALTELLFMIREFGCLGEIIGRNFEVRNPQGKLVYTIRQKPMTLPQVKTLGKEFNTIKKIDQEIENKKWGSKAKGRKHK